MNEDQLSEVMRAQLASFNQKGVAISDDTILEEVLLPDPPGSPWKPKDLWKGIILWTIKTNTGEKKKFPNGWLQLSVRGLAGKLLIIVMLMLSSVSYSQIQINLGAAKTDLKNNALNIGFTYLKSLDSAFGGQDIMVYGKKSFFMITPDVDFQSGNQDAFSSIVAKAQGNFVKFRTKEVAGLVTPDADKTLHVFPVAIGAESNSYFNFVNTIFEVGYAPYYHSPLSKAADWVKHTKIGFFLQAGYKFKIDSSGSKATGGQVDESQEAFNKTIFRAKGNFSIDTKDLMKVGGFKLGLVGTSDVWFDIANGATYYKLEGIARVYLNPTIFFDVMWNKGSGAPNFNQGEQWGAGLTISF